MSGGGAGTAVRAASTRERADEWAVVLAAAGIPHRLRRRLDGWALIVPASAAAAARESLDAYDRENAQEGALDGRAAAAGPGAFTLVGVYVALLLLAVFAVSGPRAAHSAWFERGSADAARLTAGEWWRAVTALTLHADALHLLGNAVASALFVTAVCQQVGTGVGLWLLLLAGAAGNALTAVVHGGGYSSVGASTAVFGALGILGGLRIPEPGRGAARWGRSWRVAAACLLLLVLLGAGPDADVLAHVFGLLAGAALGLGSALALRSMPAAPVQGMLAAAAAAAVAGAWLMAF